MPYPILQLPQGYPIAIPPNQLPGSIEANPPVVHMLVRQRQLMSPYQQAECILRDKEPISPPPKAADIHNRNHRTRLQPVEHGPFPKPCFLLCLAQRRLLRLLLPFTTTGNSLPVSTSRFVPPK